MQNTLKSISKEIIRLVRERKHGGPVLDPQMAEIEIIHIVADRLLKELHDPHETKEALVNMFLLGLIFQDHSNR